MRWKLTETGCQTPSGGRKPSPAGGKAVHGSKMGPVRLPDGPSLEAIWGMSAKGHDAGKRLLLKGQIFIADYKNGIMQLDPSSGNISQHRTRIRTEPFRSCNDLHFASNGDLYFTDQGQSDMQRPDGRVFRLTPDDKLECLIDCGVSPNGLVLKPGLAHPARLTADPTIRSGSFRISPAAPAGPTACASTTTATYMSPMWVSASSGFSARRAFRSIESVNCEIGLLQPFAHCVPQFLIIFGK